MTLTLISSSSSDLDPDLMASGRGKACTKCAQVLLVLLNVVFALLGAVVLVLGVWIRFTPSMAAVWTEGAALGQVRQDVVRVAIFLVFLVAVTVGGVVFVASLLGCIGACARNRCMLIAYLVLAILVIIASIGAGSLAFYSLTQIETTTKAAVDSMADLKGDLESATYVEMYSDQDSQYLTYTTMGFRFNTLQHELHCCGVDGPEDWEANPSIGKVIENSVPLSCCPLKVSADVTKPQRHDLNTGYLCETPYRQGCQHAMKSLFDENAATVMTAFGSISLVIGLMQCCGFLCAVAIVRRKKSRKR